MLDDIDYSGLQVTEETPKKKAGVSQRSVTKAQKLERKSIDESALAEKAQAMSTQMGEPEIPDALTRYALPAIGVLGGLATAYGLWKHGESKANYPSTQAPELSVPADNKGPVATQSVEQNVVQSEEINKLEQLKERLKAGQQTVTPDVPTVPAASVPPPVQAAPAAPVQAPVATAPAELAAPAPVEAVIPEKTSNIVQRVRRTNAQIAADKAALEAAAPPGFHPQYKKGTGQMGPGAYNWLYGQEGEKTPGVWRDIFGEKNIPYSQEPTSELQSKYASYRQSAPEPGGGLNELPRSAEGGASKKPKYVPEYIKGSISPAMALNLAGNALGIAGLKQAYEHGKQTGDWSELGLGTIGQILGNVAPKAGMALSLMTPSTLNAGEEEELKKRRKSGATIDRAVAPR